MKNLPPINPNRRDDLAQKLKVSDLSDDEIIIRTAKAFLDSGLTWRQTVNAIKEFHKGGLVFRLKKGDQCANAHCQKPETG